MRRIVLCLVVLTALFSAGIQSYAIPIDYHWGIAGIEVVYAYSPVGEEEVHTQGIVVGQVIDLQEAPGSWTVGRTVINFSSITHISRK